MGILFFLLVEEGGISKTKIHVSPCCSDSICRHREKHRKISDKAVVTEKTFRDEDAPSPASGSPWPKELRPQLCICGREF